MSGAQVDTTNSQAVGGGTDPLTGDDCIIVLLPQQMMTKAEALRHAAWLVALADDDEQFAAILAAVRST